MNEKDINGGTREMLDGKVTGNDDDAELIHTVVESHRDEVLKTFTRHQDFPKKGILFVNVLPMFASPRCVQIVIDAMAKSLSNIDASLVCGIEARGFLFGTLLAQALKLPFVCIRKAGKLPGECQSLSYDLEYGQATIQVQRDSLVPAFVGKSAIICDDLLATGGTAKATVSLLEALGVKTSCIVVLVELLGLGGAKALKPTRVMSFAKEA
jgi:adenine phosphoribosyltransferase